jgi:hypothetical protein
MGRDRAAGGLNCRLRVIAPSQRARAAR